MTPSLSLLVQEQCHAGFKKPWGQGADPAGLRGEPMDGFGWVQKGIVSLSRVHFSF